MSDSPSAHSRAAEGLTLNTTGNSMNSTISANNHTNQMRRDSLFPSYHGITGPSTPQAGNNSIPSTPYLHNSSSLYSVHHGHQFPSVNVQLQSNITPLSSPNPANKLDNDGLLMTSNDSISDNEPISKMESNSEDDENDSDQHSDEDDDDDYQERGQENSEDSDDSRKKYKKSSDSLSAAKKRKSHTKSATHKSNNNNNYKNKSVGESANTAASVGSKRKLSSADTEISGVHQVPAIHVSTANVADHSGHDANHQLENGLNQRRMSFDALVNPIPGLASILDAYHQPNRYSRSSISGPSNAITAPGNYLYPPINQGLIPVLQSNPIRGQQWPTTVCPIGRTPITTSVGGLVTSRYLLHFAMDLAQGAQEGLYQPGKPSELIITMSFHKGHDAEGLNPKELIELKGTKPNPIIENAVNAGLYQLVLPVKIALKPTVKRTAKIRGLSEVSMHPECFNCLTRELCTEEETWETGPKVKKPHYLLLRRDTGEPIRIMYVNKWLGNHVNHNATDPHNLHDYSPIHIKPVIDDGLSHVQTKGRGKTEERKKETSQLYLALKCDRWFEFRCHHGWKIEQIELRHFKGGTWKSSHLLPYQHLSESISIAEAIQAIQMTVQIPTTTLAPPNLPVENIALVKESSARRRTSSNKKSRPANAHLNSDMPLVINQSLAGRNMMDYSNQANAPYYYGTMPMMMMPNNNVSNTNQPVYYTSSNYPPVNQYAPPQYGYPPPMQLLYPIQSQNNPNEIQINPNTNSPRNAAQAAVVAAAAAAAAANSNNAANNLFANPGSRRPSIQEANPAALNNAYRRSALPFGGYAEDFYVRRPSTSAATGTAGGGGDENKDSPTLRGLNYNEEPGQGQERRDSINLNSNYPSFRRDSMARVMNTSPSIDNRAVATSSMLYPAVMADNKHQQHLTEAHVAAAAAATTAEPSNALPLPEIENREASIMNYESRMLPLQPMTSTGYIGNTNSVQYHYHPTQAVLLNPNSYPAMQAIPVSNSGHNNMNNNPFQPPPLLPLTSMGLPQASVGFAMQPLSWSSTSNYYPLYNPNQNTQNLYPTSQQTAINNLNAAMNNPDSKDLAAAATAANLISSAAE
jgi:hypothetical protein